jgi:hypothetical protein
VFLLGFEGNATDFNPFAACSHGKRSPRSTFSEGDHASKARASSENMATDRQSLSPVKGEIRPPAYPGSMMEKELTSSLRGEYSISDIESADFVLS